MIKGLTDKPVLRRDGKIRAGYKDEKTRKLVNTDHFLLHDAPQLIEKLGEHPTEIYFTIHTDVINEVARADLRRYTSSELVCMSRHATKVDGIDAEVAAFFGTGDAPNVTGTQFPGINRARVRKCLYQTCPDYVSGSCSEHLFLDMLIPQYSMGAIFTLDSTSINAILNVFSTLQKTATRFAGRVAGEIFRLYKKPGEITFESSSGKRGKAEAPIIFIEHVPFVKYEALFRDQILPEDWEALTNMRNRSGAGLSLFSSAMGAPALDAPVETSLLEAPAQGSIAQLATEAASTPPVKQEDEDAKYTAIANDPALTKLFDEISSLIGKENTEANRVATVRMKGSVQATADYLKARIGDIKRTQKKAAPQEATSQDKAAAIDTTATKAAEKAATPAVNSLY